MAIRRVADARTANWQPTAVDDWVAGLSGTGADRDEAVHRLHALMVRAAGRQVGRMTEARRLGREECEEIVQSSADEATLAVLSRLGSFEGRSRFTTWAYKFAILQVAVEVRRAAWRHRDVALDLVPDPPDAAPTPEEHAETGALVDGIRRAMAEVLTAHQSRVMTALLFDGVPIDVLADRLSTTRNSLYKTLYDARRRVRQELVATGLIAATGPIATTNPKGADR